MRQGHRSALVVMPTGTGKTIVFCELARLVASRTRVLVLTHRQELVTQTAARLRSWTGLPVGVEMAGQKDASRPSVDSLNLFDETVAEVPRIVVGSIQSMTEKRCNLIGAATFGWVILDEAHHAVSPTWLRLISFFRDGGARIVGVTATPDRSDGKPLGRVFETVAFEFTIQEAIAEGWLVRPKLLMVQTRLDLSPVRTRAGDLVSSDMEAQLDDVRKIAEICEPFMKEGPDRPGVLFMPGVQSSRNAAAYMNAHSGVPGYSVSLDGTMDRESERSPEVAALERGDRKALVNCQLLTEGWDCPMVSKIGLGFRTKSRAKYAQVIGRGTRPHPESGKTDLLILDFRWLSEDHSIVAATDIFQGDLSDDVADFAREKARSSSDEVDVSDLVNNSLDDYLKHRQEIIYTLMRKDPFAAVGIDLAAYQSSVIREPVTPAQADVLRSKGLGDADIATLSKQTASRVLEKLFERADRGLCTPKQARALARAGVDARDFSFDEARALLDFVSTGGSWRKLPANFDVDGWRRDRAPTAP